MSNPFDNIRKFNAIFKLNDCPVTAEQFNARVRRFKEIITEEVQEADEIVARQGEDSSEALTALADWLGDIIVYAASEMIRFGLPPEEIINIIMKSNFSKLGPNDQPIMVNGKVQKGPNYFKPEPAIRAYLINARAEVLKQEVEQSIYGANARQVGGTHYQQEAGVPQHWDLAIMYQWDPFQYQITKYVMRWKDKHPTPEKKLVDLQKARHFLDKYIENYMRYLPAQPTTAVEVPPTAVNQAPHVLSEHWQVEGYFGDMTQEYSCIHCKSRTRAAFAPPPHGCTPTGAGKTGLDGSTQAREHAAGGPVPGTGQGVA